MSHASHTVPVLFVDDSPDILALYEQLINMEDDLRCVAALDSTVGLEAAVRSSGARVAVIDLVGTGRDAIEAIRSLSVEFPQCRVIAFTGRDDPDTHDLVIDAGAWALVSKDAEPRRLFDEIRQVAAHPAA